MIELYSWPTSNGRKIFIMLEETGLPYRIHPVNIREGDQFKPDFLKISPNNKIPAMIDPDGPDGEPISLFESGAILMYLARKSGQFFPADPRGQFEVLPWLFFQVGHVGPAFGQAHHFRAYAPAGNDYAAARFTKESGRVYGVLDRRLAEAEFLAGAYSIADMAIFPWTQGHANQGQSLSNFPNVNRWFDAMAARPAVQKALSIMAEVRNRPMTAAARDVMFGDKQYEQR